MTPVRAPPPLCRSWDHHFDGVPDGGPFFPELRDGTAYYFLRSVASGHPGVITTIHANSAAMAWETLTLLVRESEGAGDLERDDIKGLLRQTVGVVVQMQRVGNRYRVVEIEYAPLQS